MNLYERPFDPTCPTICFDEQNVQLLADRYPELPLKPGYVRRRDYEYVRRGTRNVFIFLEPKAGRRHLLVTRRRTKHEWAKAIRYLVDVLYPNAQQIDLVYDNLNTHTVDTLIEIFGKPEADRLLARLRFHSTPLHASWLTMAEIDLSTMTRQCLSRRIPDEWTLVMELIAWETCRNHFHQPIAWSFNWKRARRIFRKRKCPKPAKSHPGQN